MYLDDLTIYNDYTKKLAKSLTKSIKSIKEEQIKHCFLYLTESQKTSDRLYEFYYNRYYYTKVKRLISMPTFLSIDNDDFDRVIKEIKKVDK
jgi:dTDP-4-amino-4,6-dideoxygalactose transaminase